MMVEMLMNLVLAVIQFLFGLALGIGTIYLSIRLFDKFTHGINEWNELKKGNIAVGILFAAVILSIAIIIQEGVMALTNYISEEMSLPVLLVTLIIGLINLTIAVLIAILAVYVALRVLDKITSEIDEMEELKKGNVAVAILMSAVLLAVSFVIKGAVAGITNIINVVTILEFLGM